jgi:hypothetical protein
MLHKLGYKIVATQVNPDNCPVLPTLDTKEKIGRDEET